MSILALTVAAASVFNPFASPMTTRVESPAFRPTLTAMTTPAVVQTLGLVGGPGITETVVLGGSTDVYTLTFRGYARAKVGLQGDGISDLDITVYDSRGRIVATDLDMTDTCYVEWTPMGTQTFTVKVRNRGALPNRYIMLTN